MRYKLLVAIFILFSVCTFGQSDKADKNFNMGTKAYEAGKYQDAVSFFTLTINDSPTSNSYFNRALAYYKLGDSCSFCADLKIGSNLGDNESKKLYVKYCIYTLVNNNLADSLKLKYKHADHLEITHEICTSDTAIVVISKKDDQTWSDDLTEILKGPVFTVVESMPEFIGGEYARAIFLANNIKYPTFARESSIQGIVYIQFIIEKDGSVSNAKVLKGIGGGCDAESLRVVNMMPKWIPGIQNGKPVRVLFNMPISYKLSGRK